MILIDFSPVVISRYTSIAYGSDDSYNIDIDLVRFATLRTIADINSKFKQEYGEIVIAIDSKLKIWRKDIFPYYKQNRKEIKSKSKINWNQLLDYLNQIKDELIANLRFKVIEVDHAEADDVIGVLSRYCVSQNQQCLIVSRDKDFIQLQADNDLIKQYSLATDSFISNDDPRRFIFEQVLRGDRADGIPNILSPADSFISKVHQKRLTQKMIDSYWLDRKQLDSNLRYQINKRLIMLNYIPKEIRDKVINGYKYYSIPKGQDVLKYLIQTEQKQLLDRAGDLI